MLFVSVGRPRWRRSCRRTLAGAGGRTLSLDSAGEGLLQAQVPLGGLDFPAFRTALEGFAASGEQWSGRLRDLNQGAAEAAEPTEAAAPPGAGMIRG